MFLNILSDIWYTLNKKKVTSTNIHLKFRIAPVYFLMIDIKIYNKNFTFMFVNIIMWLSILKYNA
jgi:hypothetical protein